MHPSRAGLLAFCDAEAGAGRRQRIANHLAKCERCSGELRRIRREKDELSMSEIAGSEIAGSEITGATGDLQSGLAELLSSMAAWREGRTVGLASAVKSRVRSQIEIYLGASAVSLLDRPGMRADALLANAGEILDALLGPAAAEAVRDDVLSGLDCARRAAQTHPRAPAESNPRAPAETYPRAPAETHPRASAETPR